MLSLLKSSRPIVNLTKSYLNFFQINTCSQKCIPNVKVIKCGNEILTFKKTNFNFLVSKK